MFILFLALFSLDVFDGNYGFWETALALFMHNIPSLVLTIVLIIAWKYELVGAIVFLLAGCAYVTTLFINILGDPSAHWWYITWTLPISGPAFLIGILFLIGWWKKKK